MAAKGVSFERIAGFAIHPHSHGAVLHAVQFSQTEEAKPDKGPCRTR